MRTITENTEQEITYLLVISRPHLLALLGHMRLKNLMRLSTALTCKMQAAKRTLEKRIAAKHKTIANYDSIVSIGRELLLWERLASEISGALQTTDIDQLTLAQLVAVYKTLMAEVRRVLGLIMFANRMLESWAGELQSGSAFPNERAPRTGGERRNEANNSFVFNKST